MDSNIPDKRGLILSRKQGESIVIGDNIEVTVVAVGGNKVRLAINAPNDIPVHRREVYDRIVQEQKTR